MHDKIIYFVSSFSEQIVHELRELINNGLDTRMQGRI